MIEPLLKDEAFLRDIGRAPADPARFHLWWLGQSGFLLQWYDRHLLLDPYLSDSLTVKYAATPRPHIRMTARIVDPARLDFIDLATSSHNHTDHLDAQTLGPLLAANPEMKLLIPEANRSEVAQRLGIDPGRPLGLDAGQSLRLQGFEFTAVASAHEGLEYDAEGRSRYLGYILRFGSWTLYHSGDTLCYPGLAESLRPWRIDLALLPINGRDPARGVAGNLSGPEAARLGREMGARLVIPCHYEMFTFNTADPALFLAAAAELGQPVRVLRCGERWSSAELEPGALRERILAGQGLGGG